MKKFFKFCLLTLMITLSMSSVSFAGFQYLWRISSGTYVSNYHPDYYFADTYDGTASVRGTDRGYDSKTGHGSYYVWTQITYNVQGTIYKARAQSKGKNDSVARVKTVRAYDKWNNGEKTRAYYKYHTARVDTKPGPIPTKKIKKLLNK
ncbi:hypothetical protein [Parvimonas micra]